MSMKLTSSQCIVIKIGSSLLIDEQGEGINVPWLTSLIDDVTTLIQQQKSVVLVSSGAVALGRFLLGDASQLCSLDGKQAASAIGQIQLLQHYHTLFAAKQIKTAQVLLTLDDTEDRRRYINLRNTFKKLLELNVVPIVNENDSVGTNEIRYGDNDRLSARVAQMVDADTLILLSDIDGFYTDNPHTNKEARLLSQIEHLTADIVAMAKESSTNVGSGGMITKLDAARIVMNSGCHMVITSGKHLHPITHYLQTEKGTWFVAQDSSQNMKKVWLREHLKPMGTLIIDDGALKALQQGASLLPVGIVKVIGKFQKGAAVKVMTSTQQEVARGLTNYGHDDLLKIIGQKTNNIMTILGYNGCHEAIHRDNLALLN